MEVQTEIHSYLKSEEMLARKLNLLKSDTRTILTARYSFVKCTAKEQLKSLFILITRQDKFLVVLVITSINTSLILIQTASVRLFFLNPEKIPSVIWRVHLLSTFPVFFVIRSTETRTELN